MENLLAEEIPPDWMWPFDDLLADWFDEVKAKRDEKYGTASNEESVPLAKNEYAVGRGR